MMGMKMKLLQPDMDEITAAMKRHSQQGVSSAKRDQSEIFHRRAEVATLKPKLTYSCLFYRTEQQ